MYTLLSNSLDRIDVHGFLERVTIALNDQHDIKMLAYLMLIRLGKVAPSAVTQSKKKKIEFVRSNSDLFLLELDDLVEPLKTTLDFKMRSNAVKQEVEKNQELIRADLRCILSLSSLCDEGNTSAKTGFLSYR